MKTVTSLAAAALAATLATSLIAGTARAHPPTDWSALESNRQAAETVRKDADREAASRDQRGRQSERKAEKPARPVDIVVRFGTPNRY